ncbi:hypothetical protein [Methylobacterium sp. WL9]|uniref:hypothetical protein n=1 Tax=Methylobacterium sp. WL9 TaxID=2603898 RepID=UPI0011CA24A1|nr:hypothetical protein [Methylobacterium sp. WL9]TXN21017.1 hypothetical protein FV217_15785 [Methylobacterium sp. WL9]
MTQALDLTSRQIAAIRACGFHPGGLRTSAYPKTMPSLVAAGLVEQRQKVDPAERHQMGWFLTAAGKRLLQSAGTGEPSA